MEGGCRQSRLLGRLFGRLRGDHRYTVDKRYPEISEDSVATFSNNSTTCYTCRVSEGCDIIDDFDDTNIDAGVSQPSTANADSITDDDQFPANIDLRYGGQYLTPEQLPKFCNQLHQLVEIIRNIQSYSKVTGEYPGELERRLNIEASEVASLVAEAQNARDVIARTRLQRQAVRAQKRQLTTQMCSLKETEIRELESTVRMSDRKLYKSWETLKDSNDPSVFEPLLEEIQNKQTALECLVRLILGRRLKLMRSVPPSSPQPLPPPLNPENDDDTSTTTATSGGGKRQEVVRRAGRKRRRKDSSREVRSVPLSVEPSQHGPQPQLVETTSRYRAGSTGAVVLTSVDLSSRGSDRDILFFTIN